MKNGLLQCICTILLVSICLTAAAQSAGKDITGAWKSVSDTAEQVLVFQDNYISQTSYTSAGKRFHYTRGGRASLSKGQLRIDIEFNSADKDQVGTSVQTPVTISGNKMTTKLNGVSQQWTRIDDGSKNLAGCWRINGRWDGKEMGEIKEGPRKTLKLLSGTRFQWFAINTETKEFFGTGGGTYTFSDGKYTENIDFFSRDNSRVGASLTFDARLENGVWHHSGLSSKGEPIKETWIRYTGKNK